MKTPNLVSLPLGLLGVALLASPVWASTYKDKHSAQADGSTSAVNDGSKDLEVSVPHPALTPEQGTEIYSVYETPSLLVPKYGESARLDISASSWVPGSLTAPTHLADASAFSGSGVPLASLTFFTSPIVHWKRVTVSLMGGLGFGVVQRTGTFAGDDSTPPQAVKEDGYVVPVTLGAEARLDIKGPWSAFGDLALMPVAAFTTRTIFVTETGNAVYGVPLEASLGIANDLYWLSSSLRGVKLKAGAVATVNTFGPSDFSGLGGVAGVSVPL